MMLLGRVLSRTRYRQLRALYGMGPSVDMKSLWKTADCVCFDVDSTVCRDEAIDELAAFIGVGDKVAKLTNQAMSGSMTYKESLAQRLQIIKPSRKLLEQFVTEHPPKLTPGISELVKMLHDRGVAVFLITGGFQRIAESVAEKLDIDIGNIFANRIIFEDNGDYADFDHSCLTCESGGKPKVIQLLKDRGSYRRLVHIGDGATDMEAWPPADGFIGFGGNQVRETVKAGSPWFVMSFQELIDELQRASS